MPRRSFVVSALFVVPVVLAAGCSSGAPSGSEVTASGNSGGGGLSIIARHWYAPNCPMTARPGVAKCMSHTVTDQNGKILSNATPQGYGPPDLVAAYGLPSSGGAGATIAIVDAQDAPNAEADFNTYRAQYGLPACTTANGCFKKVNQNGVQGSYPSADSGWAVEIALDLDMASAACPGCNILLVEANSANMSDLGAAVNQAAAMGATVISNSYGGPEDSSVTSSESFYNHPGILVTASAGDSGYGASYPATSQYVLAVGGTSLTKSAGTSRGWTESAWSSGGSGCSAYIAQPSYQTGTQCSFRAEADVSAVGDPNTGVAVYESGSGGFIVVGGTSASSPLVASIFALTGKAAGATPQFPWSNHSLFFDVTSGTNGSCSPSILCTAGAGWDGPTGWGSPNAALWGTSSGSSSGSGGSSSSSGSGGSSSSSGGSSSSSGGSSSSSGGSSSSSGGSSSSSGSGSGGSTSSSSGGGGACTHSDCSTGASLTSSCDPCVTEICAQDSYCCNTLWDNICVGEVGSICGESCTGGGSSSSGGSGSSGGSTGSSGGGSGGSSSGASSSGSGGGGGIGSCKHDPCAAGAKLKKTCDACVTDICATDSYCCSVTWDSICVSEVGSICGDTCQ
jgi:hypothetical protein